jgi:hypothetical protein
LEAVFLHDGAWSLAKRIGIADVRKVVFIVVQASTGPDLRWDRSAALPGLNQVLQAVKDIPIDRYSFETKEPLAANFEWWAADIKEQRRLAGDAAGEDLEFVMVDVDFAALTDRTEREALMRIPTTWSLDADTVASIRAAAGTLTWEVVESNALTDTLEAIRERWSRDVTELVLPDAAEDRADFLALANLLVAGIQYLLIRSRTTPVYGGIPLRTDEGWARIRNAALVAFGVTTAPAEPVPERAPGRHVARRRS